MRLWIAAAAMLFSALTVAQAAQAPRLDGKLPHGGRPPHRVAFPAIHDWKTLEISLARTMCFGACPTYQVEIAGDGTVTWHGAANVATVGEAHATIAVKDVHALYQAFRRAQFFWLYDSYTARITDLPTYTVTISYDGRNKSVADYAGTGIGMPHAVVELEQLIDKTANTAQWIKPAH